MAGTSSGAKKGWATRKRGGVATKQRFGRLRRRLGAMGASSLRSVFTDSQLHRMTRGGRRSPSIIGRTGPFKGSRIYAPANIIREMAARGSKRRR